VKGISIVSKKIRNGAIALAVTAGLALASSSALAAGYGSLHAGKDYAYAATSTSNGTQGRSYARHGNLVAGWTSWTTKSSSARADAGTSSTSIASVQFK
jgi:hypothetical protein